MDLHINGAFLLRQPGHTRFVHHHPSQPASKMARQITCWRKAYNPCKSVKLSSVLLNSTGAKEDFAFTEAAPSTRSFNALNVLHHWPCNHLEGQLEVVPSHTIPDPFNSKSVPSTKNILHIPHHHYHQVSHHSQFSLIACSQLTVMLNASEPHSFWPHPLPSRVPKHPLRQRFPSVTMSSRMCLVTKAAYTLIMLMTVPLLMAGTTQPHLSTNTHWESGMELEK